VDTGEASGLDLDHGAEVVPAPCALLLAIGSDGGQVVVRS
jgi:hypothetical protein